MVIGFFMDQQDQQIPVIMGILGNNLQQPLSTTVGDNRVTNTKPGTLGISAIGTKQQKPPPPELEIRSTDDDTLVTPPQ
jgi:hypothetical protein